MSRFCSDITRHMRLFELIRQQNLVALRQDQAVVKPAQIVPSDLDWFVVQAVRSLNNHGVSLYKS
ncbi:hypothetical protein [Tateyamaria sp.]|uniref:hypothetical protein n=1 Tax=Tateyamaria sp. TaxID=1929288 RepID=UPI0032A03AFC